MGLFGFKEVGGSEEVGFFLLENENLCVSFPKVGRSEEGEVGFFLLENEILCVSFPVFSW